MALEKILEGTTGQEAAEIILENDRQAVRTWSADTFEAGESVLYNGKVYTVKAGQTASPTDLPNGAPAIWGDGLPEVTSLSDNANLAAGIMGDVKDFSTYQAYAQANYQFASFVDRRPVPFKSTIGTLRVKALVATTGILFVAKPNGGNALKVSYVLDLALVVGENVFDVSANLAAPELEAGDYVGIYAPASNGNTSLAQDTKYIANRYRRGQNVIQSGASMDFTDVANSLAFSYTLNRRSDTVIKTTPDFNMNAGIKVLENSRIINDVFPIQGGGSRVLIIPYVTGQKLYFHGLDLSKDITFSFASLKADFQREAVVTSTKSTAPFLFDTGSATVKYVAIDMELATADFYVYNRTTDQKIVQVNSAKARVVSVNGLNTVSKSRILNLDFWTVAGENNLRRDQSDAIRMASGDLLLAYTRFYTANLEDDAPSVVSYRTSPNNGTTWGAERDLPTMSDTNMIPIFHKKADGTLICLILAKPTGVHATFIYKVKTSDSSVSWSSPTKVIEIAGKYLTTKPSTIIRGKDGSLLLPVSQYNENAGGYFGMVYRSTDDGETWVKLPTNIDTGRPTALITEAQLFIRKDGKYAFSFREGSGILGAVLSDDLVTWDNNIVKIVAAPESQSAVKYLPIADMYMAVYNKFNGLIVGATGARKDLAMAFSQDGITWKEYPQLLYTGDFGKTQAIEPTIYEDGNTGNIYIYFSPTNYYPENLMQYLDVAQVLIPPAMRDLIKYQINI